MRSVRISHGSGDYAAIDGTRTSLSGAAFLHGVAAGNFEFEHVIRTTHPASAMLPALLTVASAHNKSGEDFLVAMAVGYELSTRIGFACTGEVEEVRGFHNPGLNGQLATAAAVGRLMGMDAATIASAMGIAASSSGGLMAFVNTGSMTKRLHPARGGQLGLEAALLAQEGVIGPSNIIENPRGFLHAFSPNPKPEILLDGLGRKWTGRTMILKLSPVHMCAQTFVHAINNSRNTRNPAWSADTIEKVTVHGGPNALRPSHMIHLPDTLVSAQYSVPFSIAVALTTDLRNPMRMNDDLVSDPLTRRVSEKMSFVVNKDDAQTLAGRIEIQSGGTEISLDAEDYPGLPGSAGYAEAAADKYERVMSGLAIKSSGKALRSKIEQVAGLVTVSGLMDALIDAGVEAGRNFKSI